MELNGISIEIDQSEAVFSTDKKEERMNLARLKDTIKTAVLNPERRGHQFDKYTVLTNKEWIECLNCAREMLEEAQRPK
ncbi:MAG TPA: hypothetical protein PKW95_23800 [bacterium]|nr:hypothetical protein [bacterium]